RHDVPPDAPGELRQLVSEPLADVLLELRERGHLVVLSMNFPTSSFIPAAKTCSRGSAVRSAGWLTDFRSAQRRICPSGLFRSPMARNFESWPPTRRKVRNTPGIRLADGYLFAAIGFIGTARFFFSRGNI